MTNDLLDDLLRSADPASGYAPRHHPEQLLDDILLVSPSSALPARRRRHRALRIVAAVTAIGSLTTIPILRSGDSAYAGWTAYPAALSTGQQSAVAAQCQRWIRSSITQQPTRVVLSERRGQIGLALITGPDGLIVTCEQDLDNPGEATGGSTQTYLPTAPAPEQVITNGGTAFALSDQAPIMRVVSGRVGDQVRSVTLHTAEQGDVVASVQSGYFTAWWPGLPDSGSASANDATMPTSMTVQLRDGTSKTLSNTPT